MTVWVLHFIREQHHTTSCHTGREGRSFRCLVLSLRGEWIRKNVAEGETHFLPTGAQQNHVGGPWAVPELISRRLRCLRIRMVSSCCRALSRAPLHNGQTGFHHPQRPVRVTSPRACLSICGKYHRKKMEIWVLRMFTFSYFVCFELMTRRACFGVGSHFFGGWGLLLFSCTFVLLSNLL